MSEVPLQPCIRTRRGDCPRAPGGGHRRPPHRGGVDHFGQIFDHFGQICGTEWAVWGVGGGAAERGGVMHHSG